MADPSVYDADLVRRARVAHSAGDLRTAQNHAAELWLRYEKQARAISRKRARGDEAEEVLGHLQLRFIKWVYFRQDEPRNMIGLLNQMASYAYGDVQRHEASQPVTVEEIEDYRQPHTDSAISTILDRAEVDQLMSVLSERERLIIERELADVPDSEVAAELEIEPNNLHQIRWRALKRMREAADQQEWGS